MEQRSTKLITGTHPIYVLIIKTEINRESFLVLFYVFIAVRRGCVRVAMCSWLSETVTGVLGDPVLLTVSLFTLRNVPVWRINCVVTLALDTPVSAKLLSLKVARNTVNACARTGVRAQVHTHTC